MSMYNNDKKDYQELVNSNIEKANILNSVPKEKYDEIINLLDKKQKILKKNGIFANIKINHINKKIEKLKSKNKDT